MTKTPKPKISTPADLRGPIEYSPYVQLLVDKAHAYNDFTNEVSQAAREFHAFLSELHSRHPSDELQWTIQNCAHATMLLSPEEYASNRENISTLANAVDQENPDTKRLEALCREAEISAQAEDGYVSRLPALITDAAHGTTRKAPQQEQQKIVKDMRSRFVAFNTRYGLATECLVAELNNAHVLYEDTYRGPQGIS